VGIDVTKGHALRVPLCLFLLVLIGNVQVIILLLKLITQVGTMLEY